MKKRKLKSLYILLLLNLIILAVTFSISFAEPDENNDENEGISTFSELGEQNSSENVSVSAKIVETSVNLSSEEDVIDTWNYLENKFLNIDANFTNENSETKQIIVTLPIGLIFVDSPNSLVDGINIVSVDISEYAKINLGSLNPKSGTIKFTVSENISSINFQIKVGVDEKVWNKIENVSATGSENAITVLVTDGEYSVTTKLKTVKVVGSYSNNSYVPERTKTVSLDGTQYIKTILRCYRSGYSGNYYVKGLKVYFYKPYYENNRGERIYADFNLEKTQKDNKFSSYTDMEDYVILELYNKELAYSESVYVYFDFPETKFIAGITYQVPGEEVFIKSYWDDEYLYLYNNSSYYSINVLEKNKPNLETSRLNQTVYCELFENDVIQNLGNIGLANTGTGSDYNKKIIYEFDTADTYSIGVTGINLPMPYFEELEKRTYIVNFSLWDKNDNQEYSGEITLIRGTSRSNYYTEVLLTRENAINILKNSGLNIDNKDLYFKKIEYYISEIPVGYSSRWISAEYNKKGSGNFFGKIFNNNYTTISSSIKIGDEEDGNFLCSDSSICNSNIRSRGIAPAYLNYGKIKDMLGNNISNIGTGEMFKISFTAICSDYPYQNTTFLSRPVFFIRVPSGIELINNSIIISGISNYECNYTNPRVLDDGSLLYTITFPDNNAGFGYYNENLNGFKREGLNLECNMKVLSTSNGQVLNLREMLFIQDENIVCNRGGYLIEDTFDRLPINNFGSVSIENGKRYLATFGSDVKLNIIQNPSWLDINSSLSNDGIRYSSLENVCIKNSELDNWTYKLSLKNNSNGTVFSDGFYYYIPIPKNEWNSGFSMNLIDKITENNNLAENIFLVGYSKNANSLNYDNNSSSFDSGGGTYATYTEDVSSWTSDDFKDVTMIKLLIKPKSDSELGMLIQGMECDIFVPLKFAGTPDYNLNNTLQENLEYNSGLVNEWSSFGYMKYNANGGESVGSSMSNSVKAGLKLEKSYDETVTAFVNTPLGDVSKTCVIDIPKFSKLHRFRINNVNTNNVVLVNSITSEDKNSWNSTKSNSTFALTGCINSGSSVSIISGSNSVVGSTIAGQISKLKFTIDNANAISDVTSAKSVDIELISDDDITKINVHLKIDRQLPISEASVAIASGKKYRPFQNESNVCITKNSSVSLSYIMDSSYLPENYTKFNLVFGKTIPKDTKITMIDISEEGITNYYYYILPSAINSGSKLDLEDFVKMNNQTNYVLPSGNVQTVARKYIFIFDFEKTDIPIDDYSIKLELTKNDLSLEDLGTLNFSIGNKRQITVQDIVLNKSVYNQDEDIEISQSLNLNQITSTDTYNENKNIVAYVTLEDENGNSKEFPEGTYVVYGGNNYSAMKNNKKIPIIISELDDELELNCNFKINTKYKNLDVGKYKFNIKYYLSYQGDYCLNNDYIGEKVSNIFEVKEPVLYGFSVETDKKSRIIKIGDVDSIEFNFDYLNIDKVFVKLYKIEDDVEVLKGLTLISNNSNEVILNPENNEYNWRIDIKDLEDRDKGKYRLKFEAQADGEVRCIVPYTILIVD